jgi:two-component system, NarL family, response regulator LiaR
MPDNRDDSTSIRVMVVDDHPMVRNGMRYFLMSFKDLTMVGEANSGEEAIEICAKCAPDVILMDLLMPGMGGVAAIKIIRQMSIGVQIIALTSFPEEDLVHSALEAGAISYLLKNVSAQQLAEAVRAAKVGRSILDPEAAQALVHIVGRPPVPGGDLTEREREVLSLMLAGLSNTQIAERLTISRSTVKNHVSSILSKLGASGRTQAVLIAVENRLVG